MENNVEEMDGEDNNEEDPLRFPILDTNVGVHMKKIPPYFLPKFHGIRLDNTKTFPFKFKIICRYYGALLNTQKLRLFLETLKDRTLKWFISLGTISIKSWNDMQNIFL